MKVDATVGAREGEAAGALPSTRAQQREQRIWSLAGHQGTPNSGKAVLLAYLEGSVKANMPVGEAALLPSFLRPPRTPRVSFILDSCNAYLICRMKVVPHSPVSLHYMPL